MLALCCASDEFCNDSHYYYSIIKVKNVAVRSREEQVEYLKQLIEKYPIIFIEDGMDENDWEGWKMLTDAIGDRVQLVGDDLLVTNVKMLKRAIEENTSNSILVKVNQIGTLTEAIDAVEMAKNANYTAVISQI